MTTHFKDLDDSLDGYSEEQNSRISESNMFTRKYVVDEIDRENADESTHNEKYGSIDDWDSPTIGHFRD